MSYLYHFCVSLISYAWAHMNVYIVSRSPKESYQCDALSSMMTINKGYFDRMHTFRLEWQPGEKGYVHWYVDNVFRFGVEQSSLNKWETKIPVEPSYIIINTAISSSWGFPNPPWGCTEYDCKTTEGRCGFNSGFCQTLPAKMYVDHVRIFQVRTLILHTDLTLT